MQHLLKLWQEHRTKTEPPTADKVDAFVEFCRGELARNQPIGLEYGDVGLSIRLQDNSLIPFLCTPATAMPGIGGIQVGAQHYQDPDKGMVRSPSFGITGGK